MGPLHYHWDHWTITPSGLTVFTDGSGKTRKAIVTWKDDNGWQTLESHDNGSPGVTCCNYGFPTISSHSLKYYDWFCLCCRHYTKIGPSITERNLQDFMKPPETWLCLLYLTQRQTIFHSPCSLSNKPLKEKAFHFWRALSQCHHYPVPRAWWCTSYMATAICWVRNSTIHNRGSSIRGRARYLCWITEGHRMLLCWPPQDSSTLRAIACAFRESGETWKSHYLSLQKCKC